QGYHLLWRAFPGPSTHMLVWTSWPYNPEASVNAPVWAGPRSLATTCGITFVFSSWAYLDVSVRPVRHLACARFKGLPHSEIRGSAPLCGSPRLIAALHVLHRLSMPRHPPCALRNLVFFTVLAPLRRTDPKSLTLHWVLAYLSLHFACKHRPLPGRFAHRSRCLPTEIPSRQRTCRVCARPYLVSSTEARHRSFGGHTSRGATGIRTPDPLLAKQVL